MTEGIHLPYKAILFDLDGTLVETAPEIMDAVNDTLSEVGLANASLVQVQSWIGHGTGELLVQALAAVTHRTPESVRAQPDFSATYETFKQHYQARCGTRCQLYPHVREALLHLRASGILLAVVTNKETAFTDVVMQHLGLQHSFDWVVCGDTFPTKKPNPAGLLAALKGFGVAPQEALFVGDSSIDAATAQNAGVAVWLLPYGYNMGEPIERAKPDRVIQDFSVFLTEV